MKLELFTRLNQNQYTGKQLNESEETECLNDLLCEIMEISNMALTDDTTLD